MSDQPDSDAGRVAIGYARVSTRGQNLDQQRAALGAAGCIRVFEEKASGAKRDRPALVQMLDHLRPGDVVTITRLDRLARSTADLLDIAKHIDAAGAGLRSLAEPWADTTTPAGRMIAHYPEIKSSNPSVRAFNERASINAPIQGSAADIIRRAMIKMEPALSAASLSARMLLQVHDELIFEVEDSEVEKAIPIIVDVMENASMPALAMKVPLKVDARAATNWDEAH